MFTLFSAGRTVTTAALIAALAVPVHATVSVTWHGFDASAISSTSSDPVQFSALLAGSPTSASIELAGGGSVPLTSIGGGVWQATLTAAQALQGYTTAKANHNLVGFLRCYEGATLAVQLNLVINVVDENVAPVTPTALGPNVQRACRVMNYRDPALTYPPATSTLQQIVQTFYAHFGDDYDFVNVVFTLPRYPANRHHITIRSQVSGLGLPLFDGSGAWGGAGRLLGIQVYPIDTFFDLAETASLHEIGHQWINFSTYPPLAIGVAHWPAGTQARGLMGYSQAGGQGLQFPYDLQLQPNGYYRMVYAGALREFTDLDLYLMGLIPPGEVGPNFVFSDPNQPVCHNCEGPVTHFTVADVIAAQGARSPGWPSAPRHFRVATIIASRERLLTAEELALFDHFCARGEAQVPLPFTSGLESGITKPFFVATGGRGSLQARLLPNCAEFVGVGDRPVTGPPRLRVVGPNPAHETVELEWVQERAGQAMIDLYSIAGRHLVRVADGRYGTGIHRVRWSVPGENRGCAPGVYFARLRFDRAEAGVVRIVVLR